MIATAVIKYHQCRMRKTALSAAVAARSMQLHYSNIRRTHSHTNGHEHKVHFKRSCKRRRSPWLRSNFVVLRVLLAALRYTIAAGPCLSEK